MSIKIEQRPVPRYNDADWPSEIPPVIRRIYAARGSVKPESVRHLLSGLLHWKELGGIVPAAKLIAQAIREQWWITISGDYDCDGATGTSVAYRGLKLLGAQNVKYVVPNRFVHGYGLTPGLIDTMDDRTQLIITVDSGVSSLEGVAYAKSKGIKVVVTDHHLQGETLPEADAIVNPNVKGDPFPSKALAGVGVIFYTLLATRHVLKTDQPVTQAEPDLVSLLDLVALGTVADLVPLDYNNRILVAVGLRRIRSGKVSKGLRCLIEKAGKNIKELTATDFAFAVGPRLNAAGRMDDMTVGITILTSDDPYQIVQYVDMLEEINDSRKEKQLEMVGEAELLLEKHYSRDQHGVTVFDPSWHPGIVGLVASKLKEALHRPVVALAPATPGSDELRGSARSIPGFHLRDALVLVDARCPGLLKKFGGHAMAAGLSILKDDVERFRDAFDSVAASLLTPELLDAVLYTDGELPVGYFETGFVDLLDASGPWGQGFPTPVFENVFEIDGEDCRVLKEKHLKLSLIDPRDGSTVEGIHFFSEFVESIPQKARIVYEMSVNSFRDFRKPQLIIRHMQPL